ncbi:hypothetical protein NI467_05945 [Acinetobacter bohemicus]|nr:hypothetical protein [Acinetobacter sp. S4397-1]MCO8044897.1 hypothetical protein [Acinetobacter sp. S4397-1]
MLRQDFSTGLADHSGYTRGVNHTEGIQIFPGLNQLVIINWLAILLF